MSLFSYISLPGTPPLLPDCWSNYLPYEANIDCLHYCKIYKVDSTLFNGESFLEQ